MFGTNPVDKTANRKLDTDGSPHFGSSAASTKTENVATFQSKNPESVLCLYRKQKLNIRILHFFQEAKELQLLNPFQHVCITCWSSLNPPLGAGSAHAQKFLMKTCPSDSMDCRHPVPSPRLPLKEQLDADRDPAKCTFMMTRRQLSGLLHFMTTAGAGG